MLDGGSGLRWTQGRHVLGRGTRSRAGAIGRGRNPIRVRRAFVGMALGANF